MPAYGMYDMSASDLDAATADVTNMSKVILQQDQLAELCSNSSFNSHPRCNQTGPGVSLTAPIVMMSMGVLGNILALAVIYSCRREAQAHRTVFFVMLSGLAWTDLVGQLAVGPIAIIVYANNLKWVGGIHLCRYHGFMMTSIGLVTPLIVCCMSVERFLAIRFSYFYARHVTRQKALTTFILCWGVTIAFCLLPFTGFGSYEQQFPGSWCFLNFHKESTLDSIYAGLFSSANIIAIFIMIFCNIMVVGTLCVMRRRRQMNNSPSLEPRLSVSQISYNGTGIRRPRRHSYMEAQMIWFLCMITTVFTICWLPFNSHILGLQFTGVINRPLDLLFVRMASCNQIMDPWLYVIFRKNFILRLMRRLKSWFFPACSTQASILEEAMRQQNMRRPGRSRSYTVEATTVDRTGYLTNRCTPSSPGGRAWCVRNDQEDLEALKRILENEKKRPAGSDKPTPIDRRSVASLDSASCLEGCGHGTGEKLAYGAVTYTPNFNAVSPGVSPSGSLEFIAPAEAYEGHKMSFSKNENAADSKNVPPTMTTQDQNGLYTEAPDKQQLYVISNPNASEVDINGECLNLKTNDKDLKQRLLPSLTYLAPTVCSSVSSENESVSTIPRGLCLTSVSDDKYSANSTPKSPVSQQQSLSNYNPLLRNGHASYDGEDPNRDPTSPKYIPLASDVSNFDFIDDVFDTNVDDNTMLCPPLHEQPTKPGVRYQSLGIEPL